MVQEGRADRIGRAVGEGMQVLDEGPEVRRHHERVPRRLRTRVPEGVTHS